jgi:hypothetical protein
MKTNGLTLKLISFFFSLLIYSCGVIQNDISKYNYFNKNYFYNDSLKIGIDFRNDIEFIALSNLRDREIRQNMQDANIPLQNLFLITQSKKKKYKIYYFFENNSDSKNISFAKRSNNFINKIAFFEKQKGNLKVIGLIKSMVDNNENISTAEANILSQEITIDSLNSKKLSYFSILNNYFSDDHPNDLFAYEKLQKAPKILGLNDKNKTKFQLLTTINSHIQNNTIYDSLIVTYEKSRNEKYNSYIKNIANNSDVYRNNDVFAKIKELTKKNNLIILNEDHYYSKHRIFGMEMLHILKENGYKYISLEAFYINPNNNYIPNKGNGPYISEPYFAHFIREAKKLNFTILGHENYDKSVNRELGQAKNILKIFEQDATAKIFVYVGHSHIEEESSKYKWMAQYLKEISKIDPITINQVAVCSNNNQELMLIPRSYFKEDLDTKSSADYFLINNIKTRLNKIYPDATFKNIIIENNGFKKYNNKEVLIELIDYNEYNLIKELAIPIESFLVKPQDTKISIEFPLGKYHVFIKTADNKTIYSSDIIIN